MMQHNLAGSSQNNIAAATFDYGKIIAKKRGDDYQVNKEVLRMIGHDLRNPLSCFQSFLDYIEDSGQMEALGMAAQSYLSTARRGAERMGCLIDDLLDIESLEAGVLLLDRKAVRLDEVFQQSVQALTPLIKEKEITMTVELSRLIVYADGNRLLQVMVNLLTNAIKYSPARGIISVAVTRLPGAIFVQVSDQGRGIEADRLPTIFAPFQHAIEDGKRNDRGFGLGLAICKALIELHGGEIRVKSKPGQGSIFTFSLPCHWRQV